MKIKLDKTKVYDLSELTSKERKKLSLIVNNPYVDNEFSRYLIYSKSINHWQVNETTKSENPTNAKELFYTLENIQVDCMDLTEEQIKEMCKVFEANGYKIWVNSKALKVENDSYYLRLDWENEYYINGKSDKYTTITYEKFMELFGSQEVEPKEETFNPQPHYNNENGSLYKIATERNWNAYIFDVVKRLERGGKKDPLKQEIEKSIDVLKIWLSELR